MDKNEMNMYIDEDIEVYIGFSDLSEDEYKDERKRYCDRKKKKKYKNIRQNEKSPKKLVNKKISNDSEFSSYDKSSIIDLDDSEFTGKKTKRIIQSKKGENSNKKQISFKKISTQNIQKIEHKQEDQIKSKFVSKKKVPFSISHLRNFYSFKGIHFDSEKDKYLSLNSNHIEHLYKFIDDNKGIENVVKNSLLDIFMAQSNFYSIPSQCKEDYDTYLSLYFYFNSSHITNNNNIPPNSKFLLLIPKYRVFPPSKLKSNFCYMVSNLLPLQVRNSLSIKIHQRTLIKKFKSVNTQNDKSSSPQHSIHILNLDNEEMQEIFIELNRYIPKFCFPKTEKDILKYSPININGINSIRIMIVSSNFDIGRFFGVKNYVQFRRYIANLGPGSVLHYVIDSKINRVPNEFELSPSFLCSQEVKFYYFIQNPGDVVVIEQGSYLISKTIEEGRRTYLLNWCKLTLDDADIQLMLYPPMGISHNKIPIITTLVKMLNKEMHSIDANSLKIFLSEIMKYKNQVDNINDYLSLFSKKKFVLGQQKKEENVNFCENCKKEIFNYYCIINRKEQNAICFKCLINELNNPKMNYENQVKICYKVNKEQIDFFFERIGYFIRNNNSSKGQRVDNSKYKTPQEQIERIEGNYQHRKLWKICNYQNEFIYSTLNELELNDSNKVSRSLLSKILKYKDKIDPFDYNCIKKNLYVNYENSQKENYSKFSPRYYQNQLFEEKEYDYEKEQSFNSDRDPLQNFCNNFNKINEKNHTYITSIKISNENSKLYEHLPGKSIF